MTDAAGAETFSARLRARTQRLHQSVERTGIMLDLLRGRLERWRYCVMLRNLHGIYRVLDSALATLRAPPMKAFPFDALRRTSALEADLQYLCGAGWQSLPLVPATTTYTQHLRHLQKEAPPRLVAHGYLRHLGDLNGGQTLCSLVERMFSLPPGRGVSFYDFGDTATVATLAARYRAALDALVVGEGAETAFVAEVEAGYLAHERLFVELAAIIRPDDMDSLPLCR